MPWCSSNLYPQETVKSNTVRHPAKLYNILDSTKPDLRFCAGSNSARGMLEICDGQDL